MIPLFKVFMNHDPDALNLFIDTLYSGQLAQGPCVDEFESLLGRFFKNDYVVTVNSCTSALTLVLNMLKNKVYFDPGRTEVLTTALTCTATNWPIMTEGYRIKWVDVDPTTCNLDLDDLKRKISPMTKIIMLVHWGGYPVDLDKVRDIQNVCKEEYGFKPYVIEDCAQAMGAMYKRKRIGSHGNINCFSFQAIKHLTTGDGGAIVFPDSESYQKARLLRFFGIDRDKRPKTPMVQDYRLEEPILEAGYKFHMNDVAASLGITNFKKLGWVLDRQAENADYYYEALANVTGVKLMTRSPDVCSANWLFSLRVKDKTGFMQFMKENGIMVSQVHNRNDRHPCMSEFLADLPQLDQLEKELVCIPVGWWVDKEQLEYIVNKIKEFYE